MNNGVCAHCSLPVTRSNKVESTSYPDAPFCCIGCRAAYSFIQIAGLARFYDHRDQPLEAAPATLDRDFSEFAETSVAEPYLGAASGDRRVVQIYIGNLQCAACIWLVEEVLKRLDGVEVVAANPASQRISVSFDSRTLGLDAILTAIAAPGFDPEPVIPGSAAETEQRDYRLAIKRLVIGGVFGMQTMMFAIALYAGDFQGMAERYASLLKYASLLTCLPILLYAAIPFFAGALRNLRFRHVSMDVLVSTALLVAFGTSLVATLRGTGAVYFDSIAMFVLFLNTSRFLEMRARHRADGTPEAMAATLPASGLKILTDEQFQRQAPTDFCRDDILRLVAGESLAADGVVIKGYGLFDEALLSGEAEPRRRALGATVYAGTRLVDGNCDVRVTASGATTRLAELSQLVDAAAGDRAQWRSLTESLAARFVMVVLSLALVTGLYWSFTEPDRALAVVLSVLIVACPCALSIAAPSALAFAATTLRGDGVLLVRSRLLDTLRPSNVFVFDKTGTLTMGEPEVFATECLTTSIEPATALAIAISLESGNAHPIGRAFGKLDVTPAPIDEAPTAVAGRGVMSFIDGDHYRLGSASFVDTKHTEKRSEAGGETSIWLSRNGELVARFGLRDQLRPGAAPLIRTLLARGARVSIASGDCPAAVKAVADALGIDGWAAEQTPELKLERIATLQRSGERVVMIGDGVNDAPVMAGADCSIAVGNASHLARASADALLISDNLNAIELLLQTAMRSRAVIAQSVAWAIGYNLIAVSLAALGYVPPWLAAIGMSASSLLVVLNSTRLRRSPFKSAVSRESPGESDDNLVSVNPA